MKSTPHTSVRRISTTVLAVCIFFASAIFVTTFAQDVYAQGQGYDDIGEGATRDELQNFRSAGNYQPLTGIPGVDPNNLSLASYVNALFLLSIALGAMLAVIKIVLAGFKYMFTDAVPTKSDAKSDIYGALLGLGILLATFVVLYTINPQLTNLDILTGVERVGLSGPSSAPVESDSLPSEKCDQFSGDFSACQARCTSKGGESVRESWGGRFFICQAPNQVVCGEDEEYVKTQYQQGCQLKKEQQRTLACSCTTQRCDFYRLACIPEGQWTESDDGSTGQCDTTKKALDEKLKDPESVLRECTNVGGGV